MRVESCQNTLLALHSIHTIIVTFSNDTATVNLLLGDQDDQGPVVPDFVNWCYESYLCLNVSKTKVLAVDFRKESVQPQPTVIHNETVESADHFKYLGMVMDSKLKFSRNRDIIFKKGQQRLHFLRKLRSYNVDKTTLTLSYRCFV